MKSFKSVNFSAELKPLIRIKINGKRRELKKEKKECQTNLKASQIKTKRMDSTRLFLPQQLSLFQYQLGRNSALKYNFVNI